ncbi:PREDICTED: uncharacterized protein C11orf71 homolog [Elephantulus edwardii]|uniref:uncharacterized protein C11orf71 homolog n=1 Tax=Elephantulus edwardii TaxID=28737 RepID=UPI0003F0D437|nr:PREDICTED: uncharacterized protein C11orf71 homolog [Elephantulus edwardii]
MSLNNGPLSAGDQGYRMANRSPNGHPRSSSSASALAMVSGDNFFMTRPQAVYPGPASRLTPRAGVRIESRRVISGGRSPPRLIKGRESNGRSRVRPARFSPYPTPGFKLDLVKSVLQQHLTTFGAVIAARMLDPIGPL